MSHVVLTSREGARSIPRACFGFEIVFQKDRVPASRVFAATRQFIRACKTFDSELVQPIDATIRTVSVLDDVENGSIKIWLRSILSAAEDGASKTLGWKTPVAAYLVRAKFAVIRWLDKDAETQSLVELRDEIQRIATETDVRHLRAYAPPSLAALIGAAKDFQAIKDHLIEGDRAKLLTRDGELEMNLSVRPSLETIEALAIAQTIKSPAVEMILPVKRPNHVGGSTWELGHGKRKVAARIEDKDWLQRFQDRKVDVRPGDALRCAVQVEARYGHDNELIAEHFTVVEVVDVLFAGPEAGEFASNVG